LREDSLTHGAFVRVGALCIMIVMAGAIFLVHLPHGFNLANNGMEYALTQFLLALAFSSPAGFLLSGWDSSACPPQTLGPRSVENRENLAARKTLQAWAPTLLPLAVPHSSDSCHIFPARPSLPFPQDLRRRLASLSFSFLSFAGFWIRSSSIGRRSARRTSPRRASPEVPVMAKRSALTRRRFLQVAATAAASSALISCGRHAGPWRFFTPGEARTIEAPLRTDHSRRSGSRSHLGWHDLLH